MKRHFAPLTLAVCLLLAPRGSLAGEVPPDAARIVGKFQKAADAVRARAEKEIEPLREKAVKRLKALQDKYCREARLDEALAIRDMIRQVRGIHPDPGILRAKPEDIGKRILFEVTGSLEGAIWGSEVYTSDSHLGTAAVHAGILEPGQKGIVKVRILPGQKSYASSTSYGVTSRAWGKWNVSFTVEAND